MEPLPYIQPRQVTRCPGGHRSQTTRTAFNAHAPCSPTSAQSLSVHSALQVASVRAYIASVWAPDQQAHEAVAPLTWDDLGDVASPEPAPPPLPSAQPQKRAETVASLFDFDIGGAPNSPEPLLFGSDATARHLANARPSPPDSPKMAVPLAQVLPPPSLPARLPCVRLRIVHLTPDLSSSCVASSNKYATALPSACSPHHAPSAHSPHATARTSSVRSS